MGPVSLTEKVRFSKDLIRKHGNLAKGMPERRDFQAGEMARAKALEQQLAWCILEAERKPGWLELRKGSLIQRSQRPDNVGPSSEMGSQ